MKKILKFSASWCQPCKMLAKNLETAQLTVPVEEVDIDLAHRPARNQPGQRVPAFVQRGIEKDQEESDQQEQSAELQRGGDGGGFFHGVFRSLNQG